MVEPSKTTPQPSQVRVHFIKSAGFRVVHVDGAMGGITPTGNIHIGFYSERPAFPQSVLQGLNADGSAAVIIAEDGKDGIVRELDFDAILSRDVAKALYDWLGDHIAKLDKFEAQIKAGNEK